MKTKTITMLVLIFVGLVSFSQAKTPDVSLFTGCGNTGATVTITGNVTNASIPAQAVVGATVKLLSTDSYSVCQTTTTSGTGTYSFAPVFVPNYYYIRVTHPNFVTKEDYAYIYNPGWPYVFTYNVALTPKP